MPSLSQLVRLFVIHVSCKNRKENLFLQADWSCLLWIWKYHVDIFMLAFEECILLYPVPKGIINISDHLWQIKSCFSQGVLSYYFAQVLEEQKGSSVSMSGMCDGCPGDLKDNVGETCSHPLVTHFQIGGGLIRRTAQNVWLDNWGLSYLKLPA